MLLPALVLKELDVESDSVVIEVRDRKTIVVRFG